MRMEKNTGRDSKLEIVKPNDILILNDLLRGYVESLWEHSEKQQLLSY